MANVKNQGVDEINEALTKSEAFFEKNKKALIGGVIALVVIILGIFVYQNYISGPRESKASTELAKAQELFGMQQYDVALKGDSVHTGFLTIISDYSGTDAANLANLYAGLCYANTDKWEDAVKYLDAYDSADDAMISPAAMAALGNAYAHVGNVDKAINALKKAASMADSQSINDANASLSPTFLLQAATLLESEKKVDEALNIYKEIKSKYVNSQLVQSGEIDKYIERASK